MLALTLRRPPRPPGATGYIGNVADICRHVARDTTCRPKRRRHHPSRRHKGKMSAVGCRGQAPASVRTYVQYILGTIHTYGTYNHLESLATTLPYNIVQNRGCAKWGRRIGRQSLKVGWYVRVCVWLVRVSDMICWHV